MRLTSPLARAVLGGDVTSPTITTAATANCAENATLAITLTATEPVTFSIPGGADAARFEISQSVTPSLTATLRWASDGTKDFETPDDANTDNVYVVNVRAADPRGNYTDKTFSITVTDESEVVNLLTNGDFSDGSTGWDLDDGASPCAVVGGKLVFSGNGSEELQIAKQVFGALAAGDYDLDYTVSDVLAAGISFTASLGGSSVNLSQVAGTHQVTITSPGGAVEFQINSNRGDLSLDDLILTAA